MSQLSIERVREALAEVTDRDAGRPVTELGMVSGITVRDGHVGFLITIDPKDKDRKSYLAPACEAAVRALPGVEKVTAVLTGQSEGGAMNDHQQAFLAHHPGQESRAKAQWNLTPVRGVKRLIAVASGKGGVGKSTTTVGLAHALRASGQNVGILDADIYGPSIPRMMGISGKPEVRNDRMQPLMGHGIPCMSMGLIAGDQDAVVWRGPMLSKALHQMLRLVNWGGLDTLLIDMPPGTGDVAISLAQLAPLDGAIIVTTPQEVATLDARKCLQMFVKLNVPVLGVIENMSYFVDPVSGHKTAIFGEGGGSKLAAEFGVPFLGQVPIDPAIREAMDGGRVFDSVPYNDVIKRFLVS